MPLTPSEAASVAAQARWKNTPRAARLQQLQQQRHPNTVKPVAGLSGGVKPGLKEPTPKAKAKPKQAKEKNTAAAERKQKIAETQTRLDNDALASFGGRGRLTTSARTRLLRAGLIEQVNGGYSLTDEGRRRKSATKDTDMDAIKIGKRNSATDQHHVNAIALAAHSLGGACPDCAPDDAAVKAIFDDPSAYAMHECQDVYSAAAALQQLAMLVQSELCEQNEDDDTSIPALTKAMRTLLAFISGELDEIDQAMGADAAEDDNASTVETKAETFGGAIKALDGDAIGGYAVLFGSADMPDLSPQRDYFTKSTDFWLNQWGWPRPMTYHHGMDDGTRDDPIIGTWTKAKVDDVGVWLEGQLDKAHRYHAAVKELVRRGYLKLSSDSGPQWVIRERQENGSNEVKRWPLLTASPTVAPAEPRLAALTSLKAVLADLGLDAIDTDNQEAQTDSGERPDGVKAVDERARRLALTLELLELETPA